MGRQLWPFSSESDRVCIERAGIAALAVRCKLLAVSFFPRFSMAFGGSGKRRGFVRAEVSTTETSISWFVLLLVVGIGVAIYAKGKVYDPALFGLDPSLLTQEAPARVAPERLVAEEDEGTIAGAAAPSAESGGPLADLASEGWRPLGAVERFTAETLYEKINGRAEQYLAYDVVGLACVSLVDEAERYLDVFVYDMGDPTNAFGIYSVERTEGAPQVSYGRGGYRVASSLFYWSGPYYVQVMASEVGTEMRAAAERIARTLTDRLKDDGETVWGLAALPEADRVPGTLQYLKKDAFGLDFLRETFTARYAKAGTEVTSFLARHDSPEAASEAFGRYREYLGMYGTVLPSGDQPGAPTVIGDMGGFFDVITQEGPYLLGVTMVGDQSLAEASAGDLLRAVRGSIQ
jgi:hypothetical protein